MISYYFPPLAGIASERAAAHARHLPALGWEPVVIAARAGFFHLAADTARAPAHVVVRTRNPEISRLFRRGYSAATGTAAEEGAGVAAVSRSGTGRMLQRLAREAVYVPDAQVGWIPFAAAAAGRAARASAEPAVILSSSVPYSAHLAAMWARRAARVPWVAEFRDPWSEAHPFLRPSSAARRRIDRVLHRRIVLAATRVIVTSAGFRTMLLDAFPELEPGRVDVVMNGFEPGPPGAPPPPEEPLRILYGGTVAAGEDAGPILQAMEAVARRRPSRVRLQVLGPTDPWRAHAAAPWLSLEGIRSPEGARVAMRDASALFLLQSHPAYAAAVPGKLLEYVGTRRPILAAVDREWPLVDLLRAHADARVCVNAAGELAAAIERLLDEHERGQLQRPRVSEESVRSLERGEQARRLAATLTRALETAAGGRPAASRRRVLSSRR